MRFPLILCLALAVASPASANLVSNGDFENGSVSPWKSWFTQNNGGSGTLSVQQEGGGYVARFDIQSAPSSGTNIQMYQSGLSLQPDTHYRLSFRGRNENGRDLDVRVARHDDPYTPYGLNFAYVDLTTEWRPYVCEFTTPGAVASNSRLMFWMSPYFTVAHDYFLDDIIVETCAPGECSGVMGSCVEASGSCPTGDTDGDGVCDDVDGCPTDPAKTEPGVCGCGVPDTDSDSDGTADCQDQCPADPLKTEPGTCGCGVIDGSDADGDGFACDTDCDDQNGQVNPGAPETACDGLDNDCDPQTPDCPNQNIIDNGDFETGSVSPWKSWFTQNFGGAGTLTVITEGGNLAARYDVTAAPSQGDNFQMYQRDRSLETDTSYRLSFRAKNTGGDDLQVRVQAHDSPYTPYGLDFALVDVVPNWQQFQCDFETPASVDENVRVMFWMSPFYSIEHDYYFDDVNLVECGPGECTGSLGSCVALCTDHSDADGDGVTVCEGDCDDTNPLVSPLGFEICDGLDNDCDGELEPAEVDADGDGLAVCEGDCDDTNPAVQDDCPSLFTIVQENPRVHDLITLNGDHFGAFQPGNTVRFQSQADPAYAIQVSSFYLWRDDRILVRVPTENPSNPFPGDDFQVSVQVVGHADTGSRSITIQRVGQGVPSFDRVFTTDSSNVDPRARTKDADVGDIDNDGDLDIVDNNSSNETNCTHSRLHVNVSGDFDSSSRNIRLEDNCAEGASGSDPAVSTTSSNFIGNSGMYDADLVDLNNDQLPELVQAVFGSVNQVRILLNVSPAPDDVRFQEDTATWIAPGNQPMGFPDDVAHVDYDADGFVDVAIATRGPVSSGAALYNNNGGQTLSAPIAVGSFSSHDVFFIDVDGDNLHDVFLCGFNQPSELLSYDGTSFTQSQVFPDCHTGEAADFNGDGLPDFAIAGGDNAAVYLNQGSGFALAQTLASPPPGTQETEYGFYDLELGDLNLDGAVDIIGAGTTGLGGGIIGSCDETNGDKAIVIWLNDGSGSFTPFMPGMAKQLLNGLGDFQRMSADLLDYDSDGDLDLYVTGGDNARLDEDCPTGCDPVTDEPCRAQGELCSGDCADGNAGVGTAPNILYENKIK